jgi:RNA polymerase sigma-70 factor (ECF subfamily)
LQEKRAELPQHEPAGGDSQAEIEQFPMAHRALEIIRDEFEDSTWEAFWRMTIQGQTSAEVADALGMNGSAVRQAKYRVLRRLRRELS